MQQRRNRRSDENLSRRAAVWGVVISSSCAIVAGGSQLVGLYKAPVWLSVSLIAVGAAGTALTPVVSAYVQRHSEAAAKEADRDARDKETRAQRERAIRDLVAVAGRTSDRLPLVREINPYGEFGVSPSIHASSKSREPYAHREVDRTIDEALQANSFVIIVGDSKAGKSRSAYEGLLRNFADSQILVPTDRPGALRVLNQLEQPIWKADAGPVILWLDDIERYLGGSNGLDSAFLDELDRTESPLRIVGTLTSQRRDNFLNAAGEAGRATRVVIQASCQVWMEPRLTDQEYTEAQALYPDLEVDRAFAEQLVAAPMLRRKYYDGRQSYPVGWSIVQVAVDWRRVGLTRPVDEAELRQLYPIHLIERSDIDPDDELFSAGLRWAREPVAAQASLLRRITANGDRKFAIFDYIVALADGQGDAAARPIPDQFWYSVQKLAGPLEMVDIGTTALSRGNYSAARAAFEAAIQTGDPVAGALAANELGLRLEIEEQDDEVAEKLYRQAMASGSFGEGNAWAANNLGNLLSRQGKTAEAMEMFQRAIIPENTQHSIPANTLGQHLLEEGRVEEAKENFRIAMRSGQTMQSVTLAALNLGSILESEGDTAGAKTAYEFAMQHPYLTVAAAHAGRQLAGLLARDGLIERAKETYQQVIASGWDPAVSADCAHSLATIYLAEGDEETAIKLYRQALVPESSDLSVPAFELAKLLVSRHSLEEAERLLRLAADSPQPGSQSRAASLLLGSLLQEAGDVREAETRYRFAASPPGQDEIAVQAAARLKSLLSDRDTTS